MIQKIRLIHWRSHADTTLEFGTGTNVIVGPMGAGKTSVMDALSFALYGTYPAHHARRISLEETIAAKPNPFPDATIELEWTEPNATYRVERTIKRKGSSEARFYKNSKLAAGPKPADVNAEIEKTLGTDFELFSRTVYSEQNNLDFFLRLSPRERKEKFDDLLNLERFERARQTAVATKNRLADRLLESQKQLAFAQSQQAGLDLARVTAEREQKSKTLAKNRAREIELARETETCRRIVDDLERARAAHEQHLRELADRNARIEQLGHVIEQLKKQRPDRIVDLAALAKNESDAMARARDKEREIDALRETEKTLAGTRLADERQLFELERANETLGRLHGTCPTCGQEVTPESKHRVHDAHDQNARAVRERLNQTKIALERTNAQLAEKKRELEHAKRERDEAQVARLRGEQTAELEKQIADHETKRNELRARVVAPSAQESAPKPDPDRLNRARETLLQCERERAGLAREIASDEKWLNELARQIENAKAWEQKVKTERERSDRLSVRTQALTKTASALSATQGQLRQTLLIHLNRAMGEIWPLIYPYGDFLAARMLADETNYELQVQTRAGDWVRVEGLLSGGERAAAALTIRLAFALVLSRNLGFLILDEPTHNLDAPTVRRFAELLRNQAPAWVKQVFVITHQSELEPAATGGIYRITREKETDGASRIEAVPTDNSMPSEAED